MGLSSRGNATEVHRRRTVALDTKKSNARVSKKASRRKARDEARNDNDSSSRSGSYREGVAQSSVFEDVDKLMHCRQR